MVQNKFFFINSTIFALAVFSTPYLKAQDGPGSGVSIESIDYAGTGCPNGSVGTEISDDGQAMTVVFDEFIVETSERQRGLDRKQCNLNLNLKSPPGWSYSLFCVDYRGYADLEKGVTGKQEAIYKMQGQPAKSLGAVELNGPYSDDYSSINAIPVETLTWSGCKPGEKKVNISTTIEIKRQMPGAVQIMECGRAGRGRGRGRGNSGFCKANGKIKSVKLIESIAGTCSMEKNVSHRGPYLMVRGCRGKFAVEVAKGRGSSVSPWERTGRNFSNLSREDRSPSFDDDFLSELPNGLMTVDSVDGELKHHYGIKWRRCEKPNKPKGRWVQVQGVKRCQDVCKRAGLKLGADENGAMCVSGEARPESAIGKINFNFGCWGACSSSGNIATEPKGAHCYQPGQKKDYDRTDLTVGCFCKQ